MSAETRRKEIRQLIGRIYDDSLARQVWNGIERMFAWLPGARSLWLSSLLVIALGVFAFALLARLAGDPGIFSPQNLRYLISVSLWTWLTVVIGDWQVRKGMGVIYSNVPAILILPTGEWEMMRWVRFVSNRRNQAIVTASMVALISILSAISAGFDLSRPAGWAQLAALIYGVGFCAFAVSWLGAPIWFYLYTLRRLPLRLFPDNPAGTVLLLALHRSAGHLLLTTAFIAALMIPAGLVSGMLNATSLLTSVVTLWVPLLAFYLTMEIAFSRHIRLAKNRRLHELQEQLARIEERTRTPDLTRVELIRKMLQIHAEVKNTPNTLVNIQSLANLFGSLALPLIGSLGKIVDTWKQITALFGR